MNILEEFKKNSDELISKLEKDFEEMNGKLDKTVEKAKEKNNEELLKEYKNSDDFIKQIKMMEIREFSKEYTNSVDGLDYVDKMVRARKSAELAAAIKAEQESQEALGYHYTGDWTKIATAPVVRYRRIKSRIYCDTHNLKEAEDIDILSARQRAFQQALIWNEALNNYLINLKNKNGIISNK